MRVLHSDSGLLSVVLLCAAASLAAQEPPQGQSAAELRKEIQQLRTDQDEALQDFDRRLAELSGRSAGGGAGTNAFYVTGYATAGFTNRQMENSSFGATFAPIFLWKVGDRLFFEAELELELEGGETNVALEYAQMSYLLNDYMTLGVGKFLNPGNYFMERLHPAWINKLADRPLAFGHDGLMASSQLGAQLHGAVPVAGTKFEYSAWISNGATLVTDDADEAGHLMFNNYEDANNSKNSGARVGIFILPELELGYSIDVGRADASGTTMSAVDTVVQSVDLNWIGDCDLLGGTYDLRGQWVQSDVDSVTYDANGSLGFGPLAYDNSRSGGYVQAAFRPTKIESLRDFEGVVRFDAINMPSGSPEPVDRERVTLGLNYWCTPSAVVKLSYQFDDRSDPMGAARNQDALYLQFAVGF